MKGELDRIVREARDDLGTNEVAGVDWDAVDDALFARLDRLEARDAHEARAERRAAKSAWRRSAWGLVGAGVAAAVAVALFGGRGSRAPLLDASSSEGPVRAAGVATVVSGTAIVAGSALPPGAELHAGDAIEVRETVRAEARGKVSMLLEADSGLHVEGRGAFVLALDHGAVEADVTPVAEGEAFAVDVGATRVAVHGTHLRVARIGDHVTVDLTEGVISVGPAPRSGTTLGPLVAAPAHVEFSVADTAATMVVSHEPADVRAAVALRPSFQQRPTVVASPPASARSDAPPARTASAVLAARGEPRSGAASGEAPAPPAPETATLPAVELNAEASLAAAVRACVPSRAGVENVTLRITTTLRLELADTGMVLGARFDPPVSGEVNACAAQAIYKTRFGHGGTVAIPIDVTVPSPAP